MGLLSPLCCDTALSWDVLTIVPAPANRCCGRGVAAGLSSACSSPSSVGKGVKRRTSACAPVRSHNADRERGFLWPGTNNSPTPRGREDMRALDPPLLWCWPRGRGVPGVRGAQRGPPLRPAPWSPHGQQPLVRHSPSRFLSEGPSGLVGFVIAAPGPGPCTCRQDSARPSEDWLATRSARGFNPRGVWARLSGLYVSSSLGSKQAAGLPLHRVDRCPVW